MKRLFTFVITMLLGASLAFAQAGSTGQTDQGQTDTTKKTKKHHAKKKKSKKADKGADTGATPK
jgi:hypothetical protein